jgi:hypothetical protein
MFALQNKYVWESTHWLATCWCSTLLLLGKNINCTYLNGRDDITIENSMDDGR